MSKYTYEEKLKACEDYFSGTRSASKIARDFGLSKLSGAMDIWFKLYQEHGPTALLHTGKNATYTKQFKIQAVLDFVSGKGSLHDVAENIKSYQQIPCESG